MTEKILIINAGSSSIKFKVYDYELLTEIASGLCERIFVDGFIKIKYNTDLVWEQNIDMPNHDKAIKIVLETLLSLKVIEDLNEIVGVGHRVVQGGTEYDKSTIIHEKDIEKIDKYSKLAPLHNKPELDVVKIFQKQIPGAKNVAIFDTSFHTTIPQLNYDYCLDRETTKKYGIKRYGYHGTSYRYINQKMEEILGKKELNLVVCHLGNGASICAIKDGNSYNTSMGLTPLEGLVMGTRCGDIDGATALYLQRQGLSINEVENEFNKKGGLKGLCGYSDGRDVDAKIKEGNKLAIMAREIQIQRIADYIVKYINQLENKVDAIIFTAGIGENDRTLTVEVSNKIFTHKIDIEPNKVNEKYNDYILMTTKNSDIAVYKVRTNEELMMAIDTKNLIAK